MSTRLERPGCPGDIIKHTTDCSRDNTDSNPDDGNIADPSESDVPFVTESDDTLREKTQPSITADKPKLALRRLKDFNTPGRLECEVSGKRHARK